MNRILSLALLLAAWQAASLAAPATTLPSPVLVAGTMAQVALHGDLLPHLAVTLARVVAAFLLALGLGTALGLAMGRLRPLNEMLDGWLMFFLNLPALVTTILCFVWFGLTEVAALAAVAVNKIPTVTVTMREAARTLDPDLAAMARVYEFGRWKNFRHVVLPQLTPFLLVAARTGLALIWKIVLVVELLGRSDGIGFKLHVLFQLFDVAGILAYSLAFMAVIQLVEMAVLAPLEKRASAWRS